MLNEKNQLVTDKGDLVLGKKGIITVKDRNITFDSSGNVYDGATKVDTLMLSEPKQDARMAALGNGLMSFDATPSTGKELVESGSIEGSNVNSMNEMVKMIELFKNFDIGQRFIKMQDALMGKICTEVGKSTN
jgi:flagellar basal-body rod protein FlgG